MCALFSLGVFAEEKAPLKVGDADLNSVVNVKDATLIQKYVAGLAKLSSDSLEVSDTDANSTVNVKDATLIQKYAAGIVTEFPTKEDETHAPTQTPSLPSVTTQAPIPTSIPTEAVTEPVTVPATEPVTEPATESLPTPTQSPTKPSVDSDGYFDVVVRP